VLHCLCEDYNNRSCRTLEKNGFTLALTEKFTEPHKGEFQYHWRLIKDEYNARLK
jgi:RimJ/RimL family protein N-acetyltransferase